MKHPFRLSKSNIIYFVVVSILIIISTALMNKFDVGEFIGTIIGTSIACILFPTIFAVIFWFILGRKKDGGTTTFNIVLTMLLLGQCGNFAKTTQERISLRKLNNSVTNFKENAKNNPEDADGNYKKFSKNTKKSIQELIETTSGKEKEFYIVLDSFFKESDKVYSSWTKAQANIMDPRILDFSLLNNTQEYKYQKEVIQDFVTKSKTYKLFFENRISTLKQKCGSKIENNKDLRTLVKGMSKKDSIQRPVFIPYIDTNIEYGEHLIALIDILERENGKWKMENDEIIFEKKEPQQLFDDILLKVIENETKIGELYDQLVNLM